MLGGRLISVPQDSSCLLGRGLKDRDWGWDGEMAQESGERRTLKTPITKKA